ncbi:MAG: phosphatidate cytidylyltransferase [Anaerolineales bacterium]|nr:phosphatidate cytidylyltransferase [Anaerolineales bacterium]
MIHNNWIALIITFGLALLWLRLNDFAAQRGWVSSAVSRKIIHAGTGPIFVVCWLLFDDAPMARWLAALVPFAITVQFALVGLGLMRDEGSVKSMSRTGDRREILRGPLFYGIIFVLLTLIYWRHSPIGITALMLLCGGDGLADILGRKWGKRKLPWNAGKSWWGAIGMLLGGWVFSLVVLGIFVWGGLLAAPFSAYLLPATLIAIAGTLVETLPLVDIDNITVSAAAVMLGHILF